MGAAGAWRPRQNNVRARRVRPIPLATPLPHLGLGVDPDQVQVPAASVHSTQIISPRLAYAYKTHNEQEPPGPGARWQAGNSCSPWPPGLLHNHSSSQPACSQQPPSRSDVEWRDNALPFLGTALFLWQNQRGESPVLPPCSPPANRWQRPLQLEIHATMHQR